MKYSIVTWHGESTSWHYIVRFDPTDPENWEVVNTFDRVDVAEAMLRLIYW